MAVFPLQFFTEETALVGFDSAYKSSLLGQRYAGQPKGVYVGFIPSTAGSSILTLSPDPTLGYSLFKVTSDVDPSGMDVFTTSPVTLDFVGQPSIDFPMNVLARSSYFSNGASPTSAEIFTRSSTQPVAFDEVIICVVTGPAATISVSAIPSLGERNEPIALNGVDTGFMPGGSVEDLLAAVDIVNEIVEARVDFDSTVHTDLSSRLSADYNAVGMASRLSLLSSVLRSNDYTAIAGNTSVVVSGSFSEIDRDHEPKISFEGNGSETTEGAVASPNDTVRNLVFIQDATTGYRPIDNPTTRQIVFGRLVGPNEEAIAGVWQFLNASKDVMATGGNGQAIVELQSGDTVIGVDGKYYEVATIVDNNNLTLRTAYQGTTATSPSTTRRRWQVNFRKIEAGVEVTASFSAITIIRLFFHSFVSIERSNFDWRSALHTASEREPLPDATTTVPGALLLADTTSRLGSVNIQNSGFPLAGGPFHTVNFNATSASVNELVPGEVDVVEIGLKGVDGPIGTTGETGDPGPPGPGFSVINPFELSVEIVNPTGTSNPFSFTRDMGHSIRYLHGNIAKFSSRSAFAATGNRVDITNVSVPTATEGRIEGDLGGAAGDVNLTLFLSSAGD